MKSLKETFLEENPDIDECVLANAMMSWYVNRLNQFSDKFDTIVVEFNDSPSSILLYHAFRIISIYRKITVCSPRKGLCAKYYKKEKTKWVKRISKRKYRNMMLNYNSNKMPNVLAYCSRLEADTSGVLSFAGLTLSDIIFMIDVLYPEEK